MELTYTTKTNIHCNLWRFLLYCLGTLFSCSQRLKLFGLPILFIVIIVRTRLTRQVSLVEQELLTLPEHLSSPPDFSTSFVLNSCYSMLSFICMFCRSLFVLLCFFSWSLRCQFFFDIRILITSLWYLQTLLRYLHFYYSWYEWSRGQFLDIFYDRKHP